MNTHVYFVHELIGTCVPSSGAAREPDPPVIPDKLHDTASVRVSRLDGAELSPEEAEELLGPDAEAAFDDEDDGDEDDIPLYVRERIEEHLRRFEQGAVVEPPASFEVGMCVDHRAGCLYICV